jgi:hypothetical protein
VGDAVRTRTRGLKYAPDRAASAAPIASRRRPDSLAAHLAPRTTVLTTAVQSRRRSGPSPCRPQPLARRRRAAPVSRAPFPRSSPVHRPRPSWAAPRVAMGRARAVQLGRARFRPSGTRSRFSIFRIYSIPCKFKNLCRIHLNSENYETNFVRKFLICTRL